MKIFDIFYMEFGFGHSLKVFCSQIRKLFLLFDFQI